jgi:hypothetical protein
MPLPALHQAGPHLTEALQLRQRVRPINVDGKLLFSCVLLLGLRWEGLYWCARQKAVSSHQTAAQHDDACVCITALVIM